MNQIKKICIAWCIAFVGSMLLANMGMGTVEAANKVKLNKTSITLSVGKTSQLKVDNSKKKIKWSSSKKSVATVSKNGKVTAKKKGTAVITAKVGKKKLTCKVTVKKAGKDEQILDLVNAQRKKQGLNALKLNKKLGKAANKRAKEIAKVFSHDRPDGSECFTVLSDYHISYGIAGENIAAGQKTAKAVMNDWMHSPGHRENILREGITKLGVGYYKTDKEYRYYWVQIFTD